VRASDPADAEYAFAKFARPTKIPMFTADEYAACLADAAWTEGDTRLLLELCQQFDLRFVVVHDRLVRGAAAPAAAAATVEQLKDRFYTVRARLTLHRNPAARTIDATYRFDAAHEAARKRQAAALLARSPADLREEAYLRAELERLAEHRRAVEQLSRRGPGRPPGSGSHHHHHHGGAGGAGGGGPGALTAAAAAAVAAAAGSTAFAASFDGFSPGVYLRSVHTSRAFLKNKAAPAIAKICTVDLGLRAESCSFMCSQMTDHGGCSGHHAGDRGGRDGPERAAAAGGGADGGPHAARGAHARAGPAAAAADTAAAGRRAQAATHGR
jgi:hypothetical protein